MNLCYKTGTLQFFAHNPSSYQTLIVRTCYKVFARELFYNPAAGYMEITWADIESIHCNLMSCN